KTNIAVIVSVFATVVGSFASLRSLGHRRTQMNRKLVEVVCLLAISVVPRPEFALRASYDHSVDSASLNPPSPPQFNPAFERVAGETICTFQFSAAPFAVGSEILSLGVFA